jgi:hypothetical protein
MAIFMGFVIVVSWLGVHEGRHHDNCHVNDHNYIEMPMCYLRTQVSLSAKSKKVLNKNSARSPRISTRIQLLKSK